VERNKEESRNISKGRKKCGIDGMRKRWNEEAIECGREKEEKYTER
jgi:hypothetical protein